MRGSSEDGSVPGFKNPNNNKCNQMKYNRDIPISNRDIPISSGKHEGGRGQIRDSCFKIRDRYFEIGHCRHQHLHEHSHEHSHNNKVLGCLLRSDDNESRNSWEWKWELYETPCHIKGMF
jgi:hypothetical protein